MTTKRAYAEAWAGNALDQIAALTDEQFADWIVANRFKLGECIRHVPAVHATLKAALAERDRELKAANIRQGIG